MGRSVLRTTDPNAGHRPEKSSMAQIRSRKLGKTKAEDDDVGIKTIHNIILCIVYYFIYSTENPSIFFSLFAVQPLLNLLVCNIIGPPDEGPVS